jgi:hypothetical protein
MSPNWVPSSSTFLSLSSRNKTPSGNHSDTRSIKKELMSHGISMVVFLTCELRRDEPDRRGLSIHSIV